MCHQTVRPTQVTGQSPAAQTQRDAGPEPAPAAEHQEGDQNQDNNGPAQETQSDAVTPDPTEQQEETNGSEDGDKDQPADADAVQGLRFSSSGDFVGFVSPVSSCSSGDISSSHVLLGKSSPNVHSEGEESTLNAVNEQTVEDQSDSNGADGSTVCPGEPQNVNGDKHGRCEGTSTSWKSLDSPQSNRNHEAPGTSRVDRKTSVESCHENSELFDSIDDPRSHKGNGTYSDLKLDAPGEDEAVPQTSTFSCTDTDSSD